jgi:hypothetical protein
MPMSAWMEIMGVSVASPGVSSSFTTSIQLFAHFLLDMHEEFITLKTLSIVAALDHLDGSQPPD